MTLALLPTAAAADPIDTWPITHGIDCVDGDLYYTGCRNRS